MPYREVPAFIKRLQASEAMAARASEFLILTAARSNEVLGAAWSEFDLDAAVWVVPPVRMKAGKEHRVPLSDRAVAIVKTLADAPLSEFVFSGHRRGKPLSNMAMAMMMQRLERGDLTVHGFRSAFRDGRVPGSGVARRKRSRSRARLQAAP